jgi:hypothetical protein
VDTERIAHSVGRVVTDPALMFHNAWVLPPNSVLVEVLNILELLLGGGGQELHALRPYLPKKCIDHYLLNAPSENSDRRGCLEIPAAQAN